MRREPPVGKQIKEDEEEGKAEAYQEANEYIQGRLRGRQRL